MCARRVWCDGKAEGGDAAGWGVGEAGTQLGGAAAWRAAIGLFVCGTVGPEESGEALVAGSRVREAPAGGRGDSHRHQGCRALHGAWGPMGEDPTLSESTQTPCLTPSPEWPSEASFPSGCPARWVWLCPGLWGRGWCPGPVQPRAVAAKQGVTSVPHNIFTTVILTIYSMLPGLGAAQESVPGDRDYEGQGPVLAPARALCCRSRGWGGGAPGRAQCSTRFLMQPVMPEENLPPVSLATSGAPPM